MSINKVVFIIKTLNGGGAEKVILNLAKLLKEKENIDSHIIIFSKEHQHIIDKDINIHFITLPKKTFLNSFFYKRKSAKIIEYYIKHNIGEIKAIFSNLTFCDKIMKYSKLPVWHIIHSTTSIAEWGNKKGISRLIAKNKTKNYYSNHPSICVSQGVLDDFKKYINKNAISIYNPVNLEMIEKLSKEKIPEQEKELLGKEYIIAVGNIKKAKNYPLLIKAYAKSKIKENLLIIGNFADTYKQCAALVKSLNVANKVIFLGFKANPYPYIKKSNLFVLSSLYEGLPTVLLESISLGIPVISTDCKSGPSEILRNYKHCLVKVNDIEGFADKIKDAVNHPAKYIARLPEEMSDKDICKRYKELVCNE